MKITVSVENDDTSVTRTVDIPDGNPRFDGWEIQNAGQPLLRSVAAMFSDPDDKPGYR